MITVEVGASLLALTGTLRHRREDACLGAPNGTRSQGKGQVGVSYSGNILDVTEADLVQAINRVHHNRVYPSRLVLPIVEREKLSARFGEQERLRLCPEPL